jgi:hypothetical protein
LNAAVLSSAGFAYMAHLELSHMNSELVTLRTCRDIHEAYLFRSVLEADGVEAFIPDEYMSPLHPAPVLFTGGVRLLVRQEDVERAREILQSADEPGDDETPG